MNAIADSLLEPLPEHVARGVGPEHRTAPDDAKRLEADLAHKRAETEKLHAEAKHQNTLVKFWWLRALAAAVILALSSQVAYEQYFRARIELLIEQQEFTEKAAATAKELYELKVSTAIDKTKELEQQLQAKEAAHAKDVENLNAQKADAERELARLQEHIEQLKKSDTQEVAKLRGQIEDQINAIARADEVQTELVAENKVLTERMCLVALNTVTGPAETTPPGVVDAFERIFAVYAPLSDLSNKPDDVGEAARMLGLSAAQGTPIARIRNRPKPVVFTDSGLYFYSNNRLVGVDYAELRKIVPESDGRKNLRLGAYGVVDLSDSNFHRGNLTILLFNLRAIVEQCESRIRMRA